MKRAFAGALALLLLVAVLLSGDDGLPEGRYRKKAKAKTRAQWVWDYRTKHQLVPDAPTPARPRKKKALDFSGTYRFGPYDYSVVIKQRGDQVTFESGGVDHQDIGGAFETVGAGTVIGDRIHARWWCVDLSRNFANNGGAEMWFHKGDRDRLYVTYYHDADEKIEDGYGVRTGTHKGERQHYRIRMKHPVKTYKRPLVLKGTVKTRDGQPLEDAVVMLRHKESTAVRTDAAGRWSIRVKKLPTVQMVAAAAAGYRIEVDAIIRHNVRELNFVLDEVPYTDDPAYEWVSPMRNTKDQIWNCGNCHRNSYDEWRISRHAVTANSVVTKAVYEKDFLKALARGDAKGDPALCSACHAPSAPPGTRLDRVRGVALRGNHCDFCHKIHHTEDLEAPGIAGSLKLGRPSPDSPVPGPIKRVYGALADSDYLFMGPTYNPYFKTSALCGGCHQYTAAGGLPAIDTYNEWRSWAGKQENHESCQSCHMTTGTSMERKKLARRICINGLRRPKEQIHDHSFYGRILMAEAVEVSAETTVADGTLSVTTTVKTRRVGHKVPTGSGDKHLLLIVVATGRDGKPLAQTDGGRIPEHAGGSGDPFALSKDALVQRLTAGDYAGLPGDEFAQVLADKTGKTHVPFWRAARVVRDTRLSPDTTTTRTHSFRAPSEPATVRVLLVHRLRHKAHDVAAGLKGPGVRPLDRVIFERTLEVR